MRDQSEGSQLLEIARLTLEENLAAGAFGNNKLPVLMAIKAIGIVERELEARAELVQIEQTLLKTAKADSTKEICVSIRDGQCDGNTDIYDSLLQSAAIRAQIYKPDESSSLEN